MIHDEWVSTVRPFLRGRGLTRPSAPPTPPGRRFPRDGRPSLVIPAFQNQCNHATLRAHQRSASRTIIRARELQSATRVDRVDGELFARGAIKAGISSRSYDRLPLHVVTCALAPSFIPDARRIDLDSSFVRCWRLIALLPFFFRDT